MAFPKCLEMFKRSLLMQFISLAWYVLWLFEEHLQNMFCKLILTITYASMMPKVEYESSNCKAGMLWLSAERYTVRPCGDLRALSEVILTFGSINENKHEHCLELSNGNNFLWEVTKQWRSEWIYGFCAEEKWLDHLGTTNPLEKQ